jgi:hypothetical protein
VGVAVHAVIAIVAAHTSAATDPARRSFRRVRTLRLGTIRAFRWQADLWFQPGP